MGVFIHKSKDCEKCHSRVHCLERNECSTPIGNMQHPFGFVKWGDGATMIIFTDDQILFYDLKNHRFHRPDEMGGNYFMEPCTGCDWQTMLYCNDALEGARYPFPV